MTLERAVPKAAGAFQRVIKIGLGLPGIRAETKYDGTPVLRLNGMFVAGIAAHPSAEPDSLVVRADLNERDWLLADAPETYYVIDHYRRHPVVLARLRRLGDDALRDLLAMSRRLTLEKARPRSRRGLAGSKS